MTRSADPTTDVDLRRAPLAEIGAAAVELARATHGTVVTYSPKVFIPLTQLCRDRCGYCTFAQAPAHLAAPYLGLDEVMTIARAGRDAGCTEALFTLGERPELRYDEAARWLAARGYASTVDYVANAAQMVLEATGLLPHVNAGALYRYELDQLRGVAASQGMMLETLADLAAHRLAPDKDPARRLATLELAGELAIPFTTGLLVGIGEDRARSPRDPRARSRRRTSDTATSKRSSSRTSGPSPARPWRRRRRRRRGVPLDDRGRAPAAAPRGPRPGTTQPQRRPGAPARLRLDDFGAASRRSPRPRQPRSEPGRPLDDAADEGAATGYTWCRA